MQKELLLKLYELNGLVTSLETLQSIDKQHFENPMIVKVADAMQEIMQFVKEGYDGSTTERRKAAVCHIG